MFRSVAKLVQKSPFLFRNYNINLVDHLFDPKKFLITLNSTVSMNNPDMHKISELVGEFSLNWKSFQLDDRNLFWRAIPDSAWIHCQEHLKILLTSDFHIDDRFLVAFFRSFVPSPHDPAVETLIKRITHQKFEFSRGCYVASIFSILTRPPYRCSHKTFNKLLKESTRLISSMNLSDLSTCVAASVRGGYIDPSTEISQEFLSGICNRAFTIMREENMESNSLKTNSVNDNPNFYVMKLRKTASWALLWKSLQQLDCCCGPNGVNFFISGGGNMVNDQILSDHCFFHLKHVAEGVETLKISDHIKQLPSLLALLATCYQGSVNSINPTSLISQKIIKRLRISPSISILSSPSPYSSNINTDSKLVVDHTSLLSLVSCLALSTLDDIPSHELLPFIPMLPLLPPSGALKLLARLPVSHPNSYTHNYQLFLKISSALLSSPPFIEQEALNSMRSILSSSLIPSADFLHDASIPLLISVSSFLPLLTESETKSLYERALVSESVFLDADSAPQLLFAAAFMNDNEAASVIANEIAIIAILKSIESLSPENRMVTISAIYFILMRQDISISRHFSTVLSRLGDIETKNPLRLTLPEFMGSLGLVSERLKKELTLDGLVGLSKIAFTRQYKNGVPFFNDVLLSLDEVNDAERVGEIFETYYKDLL